MSTNSPTDSSIDEREKEILVLLGEVQDAKNIHIGCAQNRSKMERLTEQVIGDLKDQEETYCPNCKTHTQYGYDLMKIKDEFCRVVYENEMIISINALNEIIQNHSKS